jgi:hypothetical protein
MRDIARDETSDPRALAQHMLARIEPEGFQRLPSLNQFMMNDIIIFRTNGQPHHLGIFAGNSRVLHHPFGALSRFDLMNGAWQRRIHAICRYSGPPAGS